MRAIVAASAVVSVLLAGCGQGDKSPGAAGRAPTGIVSPQPMESRMASGAAGQDAAPTPPPAQAQATTPAVITPMLAYAYSYRLELPASRSRDLLTRHQEACEAAGPALCQVVSARSSATGRDQAYGELVLQAQPAWLKSFRNRIGKDAEGAGGRILDQETAAEDLTRSIVDTEASIRAATALQTRLERLLVERPGNLQDALAIEQELARVRGTIDATRSALEVMKGRVATSKLTLSYVSRGVAAPDGVGSPIQEALRGFLGNVAGMAAALITLLSFLLLPALIATPIVWWLLRRSRARKALRPPPVNREG